MAIADTTAAWSALDEAFKAAMKVGLKVEGQALLTVPGVRGEIELREEDGHTRYRFDERRLGMTST